MDGVFFMERISVKVSLRGWRIPRVDRHGNGNQSNECASRSVSLKTLRQAGKRKSDQALATSCDNGANLQRCNMAHPSPLDFAHNFVREIIAKAHVGPTVHLPAFEKDTCEGNRARG
jgi:hypothetical protein